MYVFPKDVPFSVLHQTKAHFLTKNLKKDKTDFNSDLNLNFGRKWASLCTLPTAKILSVKNARAWVSMVLYFKR